MPFSFPASPTVGQTSTQNGREYRYAGSNTWELVAASGGSGSLSGSVTIPASGDQYWDSTLLLMPLDVQAVDASRRGVVFTTAPGAFSTTKKFGLNSYNVNRQTGLTSTSKAIPDLSTGDWTVEAWVYRQTADDTYANIVFLNADSSVSSSSVGGLNLYINQNGAVTQNNGLAGSLNGGSVSVGTWTHVAAVMSSGVSKLYVNGTSVATGSQQPVAGPYWANIGYVQTSSPTFASDLLIDDLRITKAARYTANFTPSESPHATGAYTAPQTLPVTVTGSGGGSGLSWSSVPASPTATGAAGSIAYDGSYFYLATASNTWARTSLGWTEDEATAFIAAAGIADATQASAVHNLVSGLKVAGVWSKLLLCYPFVGGSAAAHKWNLKDPRDLDAAYRLVFSGNWTHSSTGAAPDGIAGTYADTKLNPATALSATSYAEMSYYRTNPTQPSTYVSQGARIDSSSPIQSFHTHFYSGDGNTYVDFGQRVVVANSTYGAATGAYSISRVSDSLITVYRNGSSVATGTATNNQLPSLNSYLGAMNYNAQGVANFNSRQLSFYAISSGLTNTEMSAMYSAVQAFQTALSRNV